MKLYEKLIAITLLLLVIGTIYLVIKYPNPYYRYQEIPQYYSPWPMT